MADITKINLNGTDLTIVDSAATSAIAGEIARAQGAESAITSALSAEVVARQSAVTAIEQTLSGKQDTLTAGTGIQISGDVISCTVDTGLYVVVTTLPAQPAAGNENKIHLVPLASGETQNMYAEYIWKGDAWEKLGEKQIDTDLTDYWTSGETQTYTDDAIRSAVGDNLMNSSYEYVEAVLDEAGITYYDTTNEEYIVNAMATEDYVDNALSGITASYSAATETLILNIPNPSA